MSRRMRAKSPPFVQLPIWVLHSPAWVHLTPNARCIYVALKERYNGRNNGEIAFSAREAGEALNLSHHTGNRALAELIEHGFLEVTEESNFNRKVKLARCYLLTELPDDRPGRSRIASKAFMRWTPKIQNTVSPMSGTVSPMRLRELKVA